MEGMPESSVLALSCGTNLLQKWRNLEQRDVVAFAERTQEPLLVPRAIRDHDSPPFALVRSEKYPRSLCKNNA